MTPRTIGSSERLRTERLSLIPFGPEHVDDLHALWTDPDVRRYLWDDEVISREVASSVVKASLASFRKYGFGFWVLLPSGGDDIVGFAGLRPFGVDGEIELLYGLEPNSWGRGLATEAARAVLRHGFSAVGLTTIFAGADPPNIASLQVMDRLGFGDEHRREIDGVESIYRSLDSFSLDRV
ncbi:MAG: GNAT family N-acetyltransferase [Thermoanaerobaculia bacterium]|nr:GNAT family N-acetyltransferase [Thermoanaerobaculia bacterium]